MSDEERTYLCKWIEELLRDYDAIQDEWVEGYLSVDEAAELQHNLRERISELRTALEGNHE